MIPITELPLRFGQDHRLTLRTAAAVGVDAFREYFKSLSDTSRFGRFLTPVSIASLVEASAATKWRTDRFVLLLDDPGAPRQIVIAELNCGYRSSTNAIEFAVSVSDAWQGQGIGQALVRWLESRARELGAVRLYGDTFRSNGAALALARKLEFLTLRHHADWQLVRCEKMIGGPPQC